MKKLLLISIVVMLGFMISCSDSWLDLKPKASNSLATFYSDKGVNALLTGAYSLLDGHYDNGWAFNQWGGAVSNWVWGAVASDDAYKGSESSDQQTINDIERFTVTPENEYLDSKWRFMYEGITRCNDVLRVLKDMDEGVITEDKMAWYEAQAKFLRAHYYFELTRVFGKVPFISEDTEDPKIVPNDHLLFTEIEDDLKAAIPHLNSRETDVARVTKWAAKAYLAKVYLFQNKHSEAKPLLDEVISQGGYSLMDNYQDNYMIAHNNNKESILEVQYSVNDGTDGSLNGGWGDALNFPSGGQTTCCGFFQPTHNLANAFKTDPNTGLPMFDTYNSSDPVTGVGYDHTVDPRLDHTVGREGIPFLDWGPMNLDWVRDPSNGGPFLYKKTLFLASEKGSKSTQSGWATGVNANNFRLIRLATVYLWRAECAVAENDLQTATHYVNLVRERAKKSEVVTFEDGTPAANYKIELYPQFASAQEALRAIQWETRLEFAMEGHRFFDLVRWGIIGDVMQKYLDTEGNVQSYLKGRTFTTGKNEIFPIPQTEIDLSITDGESSLTQNPNYLGG